MAFTRSLAVYIVSYSENRLLQNLLASLELSALPPATNVTIINTNHAPLAERASFPLPPRVRVVDTLQSSLASGHSARYYNEALVHGFDSLASPAHDVVVTLQADTSLCPGWFTWVSAALDSGCEMVQTGYGDQVVAYTAAAVRAVGLYDERFVGICSHEADYFLRSSLALRTKACIHDGHHGRATHATPGADTAVLCDSPDPGGLRTQAPPDAEGNPNRGVGCNAGAAWDAKWGAACQQGGWPRPPYEGGECRAAGQQPRLYRPFENNVERTAPGY